LPLSNEISAIKTVSLIINIFDVLLTFFASHIIISIIFKNYLNQTITMIFLILKMIKIPNTLYDMRLLSSMIHSLID